MRAGPFPRALLALVAVAALAQTPAMARQPTSPPAFRFERPIAANGQGPRRLAVDVPLLGVNRDLSDLRLFDANGRRSRTCWCPSRPSNRSWKAAAILPIAAIEPTS